jgi:hypothetical protein
MAQCPQCGRDLRADGQACECLGRAVPAPPPADGGWSAPIPAAAPRSNTLLQIVGVIGAVGVGAVVTLMALGGRPAPHDTTTVEGAAGVSAAPHGNAPILASAWTDSDTERWVGSSPKNVAMQIEAEQPVQVWMKRVRPVLVVRCYAKKTDVFVYTDSPMSIEPEDENHTVRVVFDGGTEVKERWPDSSEHDAIFAPDGLNFARRLTASKTLRVAFTPQNAMPVSVDFDVTGAEAALAPIAKKCGWK